MDKIILYIKENKTKVLLPLLVLSLSFTGAFTLHTIDQKVNAAKPTSVSLTGEEINNYYEQITEFISYTDNEKLSLHGSHEKNGKVYLTIFDGYSRNVFVFKDGVLIQYGTDINGDLISVDEY